MRLDAAEKPQRQVECSKKRMVLLHFAAKQRTLSMARTHRGRARAAIKSEFPKREDRMSQSLRQIVL
jgi:hypothetical protein